MELIKRLGQKEMILPFSYKSSLVGSLIRISKVELAITQKISEYTYCYAV